MKNTKAKNVIYLDKYIYVCITSVGKCLNLKLLKEVQMKHTKTKNVINIYIYIYIYIYI